MTVEELTNILDSLLILPAETEVVEFKGFGTILFGIEQRSKFEGQALRLAGFRCGEPYARGCRQPVQEQPSGARRNEEKDCRSDYGSAYVRRDT